MVYIERWKTILIVAVCALGLLYALPNALGRTGAAWLQDNLPGFLPGKTVNLGLDLRGGSHLLLEVELEAVTADRLQMLVDQTRTELRGARIGYADLGTSGAVVKVRVTDPAQRGKAQEVLRSMDRELKMEEKDGVFELAMPETVIADRKRAAMEQSIEIVRRRIDETGTREPSIQKQGDNRILVQLPGVDDPEHIKRLLGQTAKLSFRLVDESATRSAAPGAALPPGTERLPSAETPGLSFVVQKRVMVAGDQLVDSQPSFQNGEPVVSFRFDSLGGRKFGDATRENVGHLFAIILDNKVISAPVIREPITGGSGVISGSFTAASAHDLALLLRAGALPAPLRVLEERTVGPGLGADSIRLGAVACALGVALVVVTMVVAYGLFGIFAALTLLLNIALIFAILSVLQATLTLPGIAGIVLTIGTAVDANVLIFERIREETRLGRSPISAVDAGYNNALSAILDANLTTLIAAFLLFVYGSGPIKGFAVTLSIGIITSIFAALMITRLFVVLWLRARKPKTLLEAV